MKKLNLKNIVLLNEKFVIAKGIKVIHTYNDKNELLYAGNLVQLYFNGLTDIILFDLAFNAIELLYVNSTFEIIVTNFVTIRFKHFDILLDYPRNL